jgi:hypothetical protein
VLGSVDLFEQSGPGVDPYFHLPMSDAPVGWRTFFNRRIQPLHQGEVITWMHLGPSCPDHPVSVELGNTEINTQVRGVLAPGADPSLGSSPVPLREKVDNPRVSLLGLAFSYLCQPPFLDISIFLCRVSGSLTAPHGGSPYLRMW